MKAHDLNFVDATPLKSSGLALLFGLIISLALPAPALATDTSPASDTVIASWPVSASSLDSAEQAMDVLMNARLINQSAAAIGQVKQYINEQEAQGRLDTRHMLIKARLLQLHHEFDEASALLKDVIDSPSPSPNARLLLANIQTQMGRFSEARDTCSDLFGQVALIVTFTCTLDADFQASPSRSIYSRLASLSATRATAPEAEMIWIKETLASMALQLGEPEAARRHLNDIDLSTSPVSLVALWMDTHLAQDNPEAVFEQIVPIISNSNNVDDAILLRLAIAEVQAGNTQQWQQKMRQRVKLREWRKDSEHAAQLARYYLDVSPDKEKAEHFASLHYEHSKTAIDAALLARASSASNQ